MAEATDIFAEIAADTETRLRIVGEDILAERRAALAVPVEYVAGPRGGTRAIRSIRGEPPRRDTGELQASLASAVEREGDRVALILSASMFYAEYLDSEQLDRPILSDVPEHFENETIDAAAAAITGSD